MNNKMFTIVLKFDLDYFDPDRLTLDYVERKVKERLGGAGVEIKVWEGKHL